MEGNTTNCEIGSTISYVCGVGGKYQESNDDCF
jgi:hypothetical protein